MQPSLSSSSKGAPSSPVASTSTMLSLLASSWKRYYRCICSPFYGLLLFIFILFIAILIISRLICAAHFSFLVHTSSYESIFCTGGIVPWSRWLRSGRIIPLVPELTCGKGTDTLSDTLSTTSSSLSASYLLSPPSVSPTDGCLYFHLSEYPPPSTTESFYLSSLPSSAPTYVRGLGDIRIHRICGIWALIAGGFHGRTGNALIQFFTQQYLAESLNYFFVSPLMIGEVGTIPEYFQYNERSFTGNESIGLPTCPIDILPSSTVVPGHYPRFTFPRAWTGGDKPIYSFDDSLVYSFESFNSFVQLFRDFLEDKIVSRSQLLASFPRLITTSWFWERGDILASSLERFVPWKSSLPSSMRSTASDSLSTFSYLPSLLRTSFLRITETPASSFSSSSLSPYHTAMDKIQRYPDDTIVLHIRVGDLGDIVVDKELIQQVVRESNNHGDTKDDPFMDTTEWFPSILNSGHPHYSTYMDRIRTLRNTLQTVKTERNDKFYDWEYLRKEYKMDISNDVLERSITVNDNIPIPLSYLRILLNSRPWKYIFILTEPGNEGNPLIQTILKEYHKKKYARSTTVCTAQLLQIASVPDTMAVLMAARHLALSSSTFSIIGGLLGVTSSSSSISSSSVMNRTKYIHVPHAGLDTLRPDHETCRLPLLPVSKSFETTTEKGYPQFRDIYTHNREDSSSPLRIIYHDIYRAGIYYIMKNQPAEMHRMMRVHGWTRDTLQRCLSSIVRSSSSSLPTTTKTEISPSSSSSSTKHYLLEDVNPYFLTSTELINFYRDKDCARIFMPSALKNTETAVSSSSLSPTRLCIDDFLDWPVIYDRLAKGE